MTEKLVLELVPGAWYTQKNPNGTEITVIRAVDLPEKWLSWLQEKIGGDPYVALGPALCPTPGDELCDLKHTMAMDEDAIARGLLVNEIASNVHAEHAILGNVVIIIGELPE